MIHTTWFLHSTWRNTIIFQVHRRNKPWERHQGWTGQSLLKENWQIHELQDKTTTVYPHVSTLLMGLMDLSGTSFKMVSLHYIHDKRKWGLHTLILYVRSYNESCVGTHISLSHTVSGLPRLDWENWCLWVGHKSFTNSLPDHRPILGLPHLSMCLVRDWIFILGHDVTCLVVLVLIMI